MFYSAHVVVYIGFLNPQISVVYHYPAVSTRVLFQHCYHSS